jgi:hypothetical protein
MSYPFVTEGNASNLLSSEIRCLKDMCRFCLFGQNPAIQARTPFMDFRLHMYMNFIFFFLK